MKEKIKNSKLENLPVKMPSSASLPVISDESSLRRYITAIGQFPILSATEEYEYAKEWRDKGDRAAAEKLITSHLRMVVSVAYDFQTYGIPLSELIASGNMGLMQALQKFDPEKGFRFSTYAMFWIKAEIYDNILSNWSIVKIGTSANQKRVFFNLARAKRALGIMDNNLSEDQTKELAKYLDVPESDLTKMSGRMHARDLSLNAPVGGDPDATDVLSNMSDGAESIEDKIEQHQLRTMGMELLQKHLSDLPERDREILRARRLSDPAETLEQLSEKYGISRERVRQIEERAYAKLKDAVLKDIDQ